MINELLIKNIAVIEQLNVSFKSGMSVLTGETGAGKSIIIDSINMILGNKADKTLVRYGEKKAVVQAVVSVNDDALSILHSNGIDCEDNELIITREISAEGKSSCRLNGFAVPLSFLKEISSMLVNIHGQHDNQALLAPNKHIIFLDAFAENEDMIIEYKNIYGKLKEKEKQLDSLSFDEDERLRTIDLLKYQTDEIFSADLKMGEEEELKEEKEKILNAENINQSVTEAYECLYAGENTNAYDALSRAVSALSRIQGIDNEIDKIYNSLNDAMYSIEDNAHEIKEFAEGIEYNEETLNEIEERLDIYRKLKRKYGNSVSEILSFAEDANIKLQNIQNADENIIKLKKEVEELVSELNVISKKLTQSRIKAGELLEKRVESALSELNMQKAKFKVNITEKTKRGTDGVDDVEFLIATNAGEPLKPLVKIASGGELSRVMLAIKSILAECDDVGTLIFDEIDTGVSGSAAQKISDKLAYISKTKQVICISHLPQIAAAADNHYFIEKYESEDKAYTSVRLLDTDDRITELARITGGDITQISKQHARELLERAVQRKCGSTEQ